jgi:hypothetical protein
MKLTTNRLDDYIGELAPGEQMMEVQYYGFTLGIYWCLIGPDRARGLLDINHRNRNPKAKSIKRYALDMSTNNWIWNGSTICVSSGPDYVLLDGQNRLMAIEESGQSIWTALVVGLPLSAQDEMDNGSSRSFSDTLKIAGEKNYTEVASLVRIDIEYQAGRIGGWVGRGGGIASSRSQMQKHLDLHPEIRDVVGIATSAARKLDVPPQYANLAALAFWRLDQEDASDFWKRLAVIGASGPDDPITVLQNALVNAQAEKRRGRPVTPTHKLAWIFRAWNAYRTGENIKILKFKAGGANPDKFPVPV